MRYFSWSLKHFVLCIYEGVLKRPLSDLLPDVVGRNR